MIALALVLTALTAPAADNLLSNPGFETGVGDLPAGWAVYVAPMEGAHSRHVDDEAATGRYSVKLHTPKTYAEEPVNNWSQNIIESVGGSTLRISGKVKTEDVTQAEIWLQCFQRSPWRVLKQASTATQTPITGTQDWSPVTMRVKVPAETDFLVVRLVIKGKGTVWFDDIEVIDDTPEPEPIEEEKPVEVAEPMTDDIESRAITDQVLLETQQALLDANEALRQTNANLMEELRILREELADLRRDLAENAQEADVLADDESPISAVKVPPLVPHDPTRKEQP
jgi:hypothetical protein